MKIILFIYDKEMLRKRLKTILLVFTILLTLMIIGVSLSFLSFDKELAQKLEAKKFIQPTEFFASPITFKPKMLYSMQSLEELLQSKGYRKRSVGQRLLAVVS